MFVSKSGGLAEAVDPHPFSIAGFGPKGSGEITLLIKAMAGVAQELTWTQELLQSVVETAAEGGWVGGGDSGDSLIRTRNSAAKGLDFRLDGPHGRPSYNLAAASTLVLIGGGIGVTPLLPILESVSSTGGANHPLNGALIAVRRVVFVWTVRDIADFDWVQGLLAEFAPSTQSSSSAPAAGGTGPVVEVKLHCTRGGESRVAGHDVATGRPDVKEILMQAKNEGGFVEGGSRAGGDGGAMVFVCGPGQMVQGVREAGQELQLAVHHETFEM